MILNKEKLDALRRDHNFKMSLVITAAGSDRITVRDLYLSLMSARHHLENLAADARLVKKCDSFDGCDICLAESYLAGEM